MEGICHTVEADFLRDRCRVFAKDLGDLLKRQALIKRGLDKKPVFQSQMFVVTRYQIRHNDSFHRLDEQ